MRHASTEQPHAFHPSTSGHGCHRRRSTAATRLELESDFGLIGADGQPDALLRAVDTSDSEFSSFGENEVNDGAAAQAPGGEDGGALRLTDLRAQVVVLIRTAVVAIVLRVVVSCAIGPLTPFCVCRSDGWETRYTAWGGAVLRGPASGSARPLLDVPGVAAVRVSALISAVLGVTTLIAAMALLYRRVRFEELRDKDAAEAEGGSRASSDESHARYAAQYALEWRRSYTVLALLVATCVGASLTAWAMDRVWYAVVAATKHVSAAVEVDMKAPYAGYVRIRTLGAVAAVLLLVSRAVDVRG